MLFRSSKSVYRVTDDKSRRSAAGVCKSGRPGDQADGYDSIGLGFFGRNFLFSAVKQATECDTARTCEMNSLGNPRG